MGNSESAATGAAGDAISARIKKEKRRAKRLGCCCCWCNVGAIVSFVVGVVLLVYFISSLGKNYTPENNINQDVAKGLTYFGIALIILGILLLLIGVLFGVGLYIAYRRINGKHTENNFVPKQYAKGTAPYPQQDWGEVPDPHEPAAAPVPPQVAQGIATDTITPEIR